MGPLAGGCPDTHPPTIHWTSYREEYHPHRIGGIYRAGQSSGLWGMYVWADGE
jgi:hypothetical protein